MTSEEICGESRIDNSFNLRALVTYPSLQKQFSNKCDQIFDSSEEDLINGKRYFRPVSSRDCDFTVLR